MDSSNTSMSILHLPTLYHPVYKLGIDEILIYVNLFKQISPTELLIQNKRNPLIPIQENVLLIGHNMWTPYFETHFLDLKTAGNIFIFFFCNALNILKKMYGVLLVLM